MSVLCGWASIDERGRISGGQSGDQGREVHVGPWYSFGQTEIFRWKDRAKAKTYSKIIKYWCDGSYVGYDQGQRTTLGSWCQAHGWSYKVNQYVETDCSRMVADGVNCTLGREILALGSVFYTGNLGSRLMATGLFEKLTGSKYCGSSDYLMEGDIINNPASHVITALANGPKAETKRVSKTKKPIAAVANEVIAGNWGAGATRVAKLKAAGYTTTEINQIQAKVNGLMGKKSTPLRKARVVATLGLHVRNKPSTKTGKVLRSLPYNSLVTCYGTANGPGASLWWKISKNKDEYVSADWLK